MGERVGANTSKPVGVHCRKDGYATALKFFLWNMTEFDHLIFADVDAHFERPPAEAALQLQKGGATFLARSEEGARGWLGLSTSCMWLTPSRLVHSQLVRMARLGNWLPVTNTEQDVIEGMLTSDPPHLLPQLTAMCNHYATRSAAMLWVDPKLAPLQSQKKGVSA